MSEIKKILDPVTDDHNIIQVIKDIGIADPLKFIDLGGGAGRVSAGINIIFTDCNATVLEPSAKAAQAGKEKFPEINFLQGSLTQKENMHNETYRLAVVSGVFTWIDRELLSQSIANIDRLLNRGVAGY